MKRRSLLALLLVAIVASTTRARGDAIVPPKLQAELLAKVAAFERNFPAHAGGTALVLVVARPGDADSGAFARAIAAAIDDLDEVGGLSKRVEVIAFAGPKALADTCRSRRAAIVYLSANLERDTPAIAAALAGVPVMSVGASGVFAEAGANLAFDLDGSRPKIVVNLATARAQDVDFRSALLKLARIVAR